MKKLLFSALSLAALVSFANPMADALAPFAESGELPNAISILQKPGEELVTIIGKADVDKGRELTLDSAYMQCSQTKGFCGVTIAKLVEEGKLDLDDPVSKYLPEFKHLWVEDAPELVVSEDGATTNTIRRLHEAKNVLTVRMCLNHTGGFPFEISCKHPSIPGGGWSGGCPIRSAAAVAAASPLEFEPGSKVRYSNTGIDIGAAVVETITGKKWEDYLKETVLDPLEMKATSFWPTDEQIANKIEMYSVKAGRKARWKKCNPQEQTPYNDRHVFASAGAGLWTTARDQLKFYRMLMNLGVGDNGARILKEETVKDLLAVSTRRPSQGGYSLGLNAPVRDGENEWFGHGGAWGTNCMVNWHKKELKLWAVQSNDGPRPWEKVRDAAADAWFNEKIDNSGIDAYTGRVN